MEWTTGRFHAFLCQVQYAKSLAECHHDMETYTATSDVKRKESILPDAPCVGLASSVLPEASCHPERESSQTGVSTNNARIASGDAHVEKTEPCSSHWYVLRTTYGREKKAYEYFVSHDVVAFYPKLTSLKVIDGRKQIVEESRIPNIIFVYGTEDDVTSLVYDNVNLPYLRFYYTFAHEGKKIVRKPVVVPDRQMSALKIICESESEGVIVTAQSVEKFTQGQTVRVIDGEFKGVVGVVGRYRSQQRVGIVIGDVVTALTAYVPSAFLVKCDGI